MANRARRAVVAVCGSAVWAVLTATSARAATPSSNRWPQVIADLGSDDPVKAGTALGLVEMMEPTYVAWLDAQATNPAVPAAARDRLRQLMVAQRPRFAGLAVDRRRTVGLWKWRYRFDDAACSAARWSLANRIGRTGVRMFDDAGGAWMSPDQRREADGRAAAILDSAVRSGCDDPTALIVRGLADEAAGRPAATVVADFERAAGIASRYPTDPRLKLILDGRLIHAGRAGGAARLDDMVVQLRRLAAEPGVPAEIVFRCGRLVEAAAHDLGRPSPFPAVRSAVAAAAPDGVAVLQLTAAHEFWAARDAAGGDSRQAACERLEVTAHLSAARSAFEAAWPLDPTNHRLAVYMLRLLTLQRADRPTFELWFRRAVATNPDDIEAYDAKRAYLSPRFCGSPDELVAFAHDCLAVDNPVGGVSMEALRIREQLAPRDAAGVTAYWSRPDVWHDVAAAFEQSLAINPTATSTRSSYAAWACYCSQWRQAILLFDQLGDQVDPAAFGGTARLDALRGQAVEEVRRGHSGSMW